jgi:phosphoglycolate phosphatase-like HAD superfamily hydrolase
MLIQAILFDLHHTLTKTKTGPWALYREIATDSGIDLSTYSDEEIGKAFLGQDEWFKANQIERNVGSKYGGLPEHWLEADRRALAELGLSELDDELILRAERAWHEVTASKGSDWEFVTPEAKEAVLELKKRGYLLGICTRRHVSPMPLLEREDLANVFDAVEWSGVPGYAKPSPFTLLRAADEIKTNPRAIAYIGNLVNADIEASVRAEMLPVLLTWANPEEASKAPEETVIVDSPLDLLEIFTGPDQPVRLP